MCVCTVDPSQWSFPAVKYEDVLQQLHSCGDSLNSLHEQVRAAVEQHFQVHIIVCYITYFNTTFLFYSTTVTLKITLAMICCYILLLCDGTLLN